MMKKIEWIIEECFLKSWWVILILLLCFAFSEQQTHKRHQVSAQLSSQMNELKREKVIAQERHNRLLMEIKSQSDPAWIELVLMKELGLVPEGQTKVLFK